MQEGLTVAVEEEVAAELLELKNDRLLVMLALIRRYFLYKSLAKITTVDETVLHGTFISMCNC